MGLDLMEIVLEAEEEFGVAIDVDDVPVLVGQLFDSVVAALRQHRPEIFEADVNYEDRVWEQFKAMLVTQLGVEPERVVKAANFITDLGCV